MTVGKTENQQDVREALKIACMRSGGQKPWAIANAISETVLSDMIRGKRDVSARIAALVGFERVTLFRPAPEAWDSRPICRCSTDTHRRLCLDKHRCRSHAVAFETPNVNVKGGPL